MLFQGISGVLYTSDANAAAAAHKSSKILKFTPQTCAAVEAVKSQLARCFRLFEMQRKKHRA